MEYIRNFHLLKAFDYTERDVKSDFFVRKRPIFHHTCAKLNEQPSNIKTMGSKEGREGKNDQKQRNHL